MARLRTSKRERTREKLGGDQGFALVVVLMLTVLATALTAPFAISARIRLLTSSNNLEHYRAGLISKGTALLIAQNRKPFNGVPGGYFNCETDEYSFAIRRQNVAGLVDLNAASPATLTRALEGLGMTRERASEQSKAIAAFRSLDRSGENSQGNKGAIKHAPFETMSELHDIAGMTILPLEMLEQTFTVYSRRSLPELSLSPDHLKKAFGVSQVQGVVTGAMSPYERLEVFVRHSSSSRQWAWFNAVFLHQQDRSQGPSIVSRSPLGRDKPNWIAELPTAQSSDCSAYFATGWIGRSQ